MRAGSVSIASVDRGHLRFDFLRLGRVLYRPILPKRDVGGHFVDIDMMSIGSDCRPGVRQVARTMLQLYMITRAARPSVRSASL